jgi:hypothetical protein
MIAAVTIHNAMESLPWQEIHNLREQGLAEVHGDSGVARSRTLAQQAISNSSRGHPSEPKKPHHHCLFRPAPLKLTGQYWVNLKAGELASQISIEGGAQYKSLDFGLLDGSGRRIDAYYITAGANDNSEATRVFPIDSSGKYLVRLTTKGPEATAFRVALGGSALPNRQATAGVSRSFLAPTPVGPNGVITGAFPAGAGYAYYYFATDLKAGSLLTQMSVSGREGASKWISLTLLDDKGRPDKSYFMSRVEANADATKSFPIDRSGRYVLRLTVQGAEATKYRVELGGNALAAGK